MKIPQFNATTLLAIIIGIWGLNTSTSTADPERKIHEKFEASFRKQVSQFITSLDEDQRKQCLQPMDLKKRWHKQYTGGKREGIQIKELNAAQKTQLESTLKMVLSDYGWKMAETVAKQDGEQGLDNYYIACFGDARKAGEPFAFRLCEHHLTIVQLEIANGKLSEFGPILLGSNPPVLWQKDEQLLIKAWQSETTNNEPKKLLENGSGISSRLLDKEKGISFTDLKIETQNTLKQAWNHRISIFSPIIQLRLNNLRKQRGGWKKSRVAYYGVGHHKRCKDGGKWDFKCGLPDMVWDFESSRGHIHMSLCIHPLKPTKDEK